MESSFKLRNELKSFAEVYSFALFKYFLIRLS